MARGPLPDPVLTPFSGKHGPDLKPLVSVPGAPPKPPQAPPKAPNPPLKDKPQERETPPVIEIIENGTKIPIPMPFQPVDPMEAMNNANNRVLMVMLRQLRDMKGPMPDTSSGPLETMNKLQHGLSHGEDISSLSQEISVHITGLGERRELITLLNEALDQKRKIEIFNSRAKFEDFLHSCMRRSDLNIMEGIAVQAYFDSQLDKIYARKKAGGHGGEVIDISAVREPEELVNAVNYPTQLQRKQLENKFEQASPMEREILRKLGFGMQQALKAAQGVKAARITKTTTETVELVDGTNPA